MGSLTLVTAATSEPIPLSTLQAHLRVDDDSAILLSSYLRAAREHVENATRRVLVTQTYDYAIDCWPVVGCGYRIDLPLQPVQSVTSVSYVDGSGVTQTLAADQYVLCNAGPHNVAYIEPAYGVEWPALRDQSEAVTVRFVAGYASSATIPESLKTAVVLQAEMLYDRNPTSRDTLESARDSLLSPYRVVRV